MTTFRAFISINIDSTSNIVKLINELKSIEGVKTVSSKNIHITLKFLGDTDEKLVDKIEEILINSVKNINPFEIQLKDLGVFPNQNYIKVVWIGIKNAEPIRVIAEKIDEQIINLGFNKEKRKFSAHLTVGRVKSAKSKKEILGLIDKYQNFEFENIKVSSINLMKSTLTSKGPIYEILKEVSFGERQ